MTDGIPSTQPTDAAFWLAEEIVLAIGAAVILGLVIQLTRRGAWRSAFVPRAVPEWGDARSIRTEALTIEHAVLPFMVYLTVFAAARLAYPTQGPAPQDGAIDTIPIWYTATAQAVTQLLTLAVTAMLVGRSLGWSWRRWGLHLDQPGRDLAWAAIAYLASWPLIWGAAQATVWLIQLVQPDFTPTEHLAIGYLADARTPGWVIGMIVVGTVVLAPIMEEFYFRGVIQNLTARGTGSTWAGIVLSAIAFGLIHGELQNRPALMLFGVVLGYTYARRRSLLAAIVLHAIFNLKTLLFFFLFRPTLS